MNAKYQIFVSSTYEDLRVERDQVIRAILEMGHIPVGMEMFSAADEEQWRLITRQIEQSDYYVVIVAHRYGSVVDGISYTEKEYDFAVQQHVPVLGFVLDDSAPRPPGGFESDPQRRVALDAFRRKVRCRIVSTWHGADDLYGKVSVALMKAFSTHPRPGWVPATSVAGPEVMREISRLSAENATLRARLEASTQTVAEQSAAHRERTMRALRSYTVIPVVWYEGEATWTERDPITLYKVFAWLGPELMVEKSVEDLSTYLGIHFNDPDRPPPRRKWPLSSNAVKRWLADLSCLDLVMPSTRRHPVKDKGEYWTLTNEGAVVLRALRRERIERSLAEEPGELTPEPTLPVP